MCDAGGTCFIRGKSELRAPRFGVSSVFLATFAAKKLERGRQGETAPEGIALDDWQWLI